MMGNETSVTWDLSSRIGQEKDERATTLEHRAARRRMNRAGLNPKKQSSLFRRTPYEGDQKGNKTFFLKVYRYCIRARAQLPFCGKRHFIIVFFFLSSDVNKNN